ncbi:polycystin-1-like [Arapaima gigas]
MTQSVLKSGRIPRSSGVEGNAGGFGAGQAEEERRRGDRSHERAAADSAETRETRGEEKSRRGERACPEGSRISLASKRCFWLDASPSSWPAARTACAQTSGGDLARVAGAEDEEFLLESFSSEEYLWTWVMAGGAGDDPGQGSGEWLGGCPQVALGSSGQRRAAGCREEHPFLCAKEVEVSLPSPDTFLVGVPLMSGMYGVIQVPVLAESPDVGQKRVEVSG